MPGSNFAFPQCTVSRYKLHDGVTIFKVPNRKGDYYQNSRKNILSVLQRYTETDKLLREKYQNGDIYICEKHFAQEDIELTSKYNSYNIINK